MDPRNRNYAPAIEQAIESNPQEAKETLQAVAPNNPITREAEQAADPSNAKDNEVNNAQIEKGLRELPETIDGNNPQIDSAEPKVEGTEQIASEAIEGATSSQDEDPEVLNKMIGMLSGGKKQAKKEASEEGLKWLEENEFDPEDFNDIDNKPSYEQQLLLQEHNKREWKKLSPEERKERRQALKDIINANLDQASQDGEINSEEVADILDELEDWDADKTIESDQFGSIPEDTAIDSYPESREQIDAIIDDVVGEDLDIPDTDPIDEVPDPVDQVIEEVTEEEEEPIEEEETVEEEPRDIDLLSGTSKSISGAGSTPTSSTPDIDTGLAGIGGSFGHAFKGLSGGSGSISAAGVKANSNPVAKNISVQSKASGGSKPVTIDDHVVPSHTGTPSTGFKASAGTYKSAGVERTASKISVHDNSPKYGTGTKETPHIKLDAKPAGKSQDLASTILKLSETWKNPKDSGDLYSPYRIVVQNGTIYVNRRLLQSLTPEMTRDLTNKLGA